MKCRALTPHLIEAAGSHNGRILVVTGARQTGKTTIVRKSIPDYTYLSIEDPVMRNQYAGLTAAQWRALYPKAILDEVQKEPRLVESIKATYDQWEEPRYVLLGSSQLLLLSKVRESLAGRCHIVELFPLTLPEMLADEETVESVKPSVLQTLLASGELPTFPPSLLFDSEHTHKMQALSFMCRFGGYPALTNSELNDRQRREWLTDYVSTYLERDVRDLAAMRNLEPYIKLQRYIAQQTSTTFNASEAAKRIGVTSKTASRYLEYMRLSYQTIILPAWERNPNKRLTKAPKVHHLDIGVLRAVLQKTGELTGNEFESMIVAEIYKQIKQLPQAINCYHLRTHDGMEVDLLVECENCFYAFEVKHASTVGPSDARHLRHLQPILDKPLAHSFVVSLDTQTRPLGERITGVHAATLLT